MRCASVVLGAVVRGCGVGVLAVLSVLSRVNKIVVQV